jgi:hypothetical protein
VILVDTDNKPLALFKPKDFDGFDQFTLLGNLLKGAAIVAEDWNFWWRMHLIWWKKMVLVFCQL